MELAGWRRHSAGGAAWGGGVSVTIAGSYGGHASYGGYAGRGAMYGGGGSVGGVTVRVGGGGGGRWGGGGARGGCGCIGALGCGCAGRSRCHRRRGSSARVLCPKRRSIGEKWAMPGCCLGRVRAGTCRRGVVAGASL